MIKADRYYKENLQRLLLSQNRDRNPRPKYEDGTPAHTYFITHVVETYDVGEGEFPITTLRNTAIKGGIQEIFWIYQQGSNKLKDLNDVGVKWWNEFDVGDGTIGKRYGYTVREFNLMGRLLKGLIENPYGRRHIMSLWQEDNLRDGPGLSPCAMETLWSVRGNKLDMMLIQRSQDYIMAGYINKIQYVALQMMVATHCGYEVGIFTHVVNNLHYYDRHQSSLEELLSKPTLNIQPTLELLSKKDFWSYNIEDFKVSGIDEITKINAPLELAI